MQIFISGRHIELSEANKTEIESMINRVLSDKSVKLTSARVVVDMVKNCFNVTIVVNAKDHDFESTVEDFDMHKAVQKAVDKIEVQIDKIVDKRNDFHTKNQKIADVTEA